MRSKFITWIAVITMLAVTVLPEVPVYASQPAEEPISAEAMEIENPSIVEVPEEPAESEESVEPEETIEPEESVGETGFEEEMPKEITDEDAADELLGVPDGISLQFIDEFGNVAGVENSRYKRLRIPFCLTDSIKTGVFTIKNLSDGPVTISSVEGESYSTFEIVDPDLNPGVDTTCTVTYNHDASANSLENPNLTVNLISGGESYSMTLYAMYLFGYRGEYRPEELPQGEIQLVGDTTVVLEDGDEFDRGKYAKKVYLTRTYADASMNFPVTLTFTGSDSGKLSTTIGYETTLDTLKIEGGNICLTDDLGSSSHGSCVNKLIVTGGKLGFNGTSLSASFKTVEISGGECDFSNSGAVYVQDSFKVSGGKFIGNKLVRSSSGETIIPEAVISGNGRVEIIGKTSYDYMSVKDLTVSDSAMIIAASNATTPLEIRGTLTLGNDVKVLLPAGGKYDPTWKRFKDSAGQDYYGTVKIGPEPSETPENPSFTISTEYVDCGAYVKNHYPSPYPEADKKVVTVTNTGDSELLFSALRPENFYFSGYSKVKLVPGETMTFKIWPKKKNPSSAQRYEENFTIKTDAGVSESFTAGFSVVDPQYRLAFSPTAVEFPLLYLGSSPTSQEVTVRNDSNLPCTITGASATNFTANVTEWPKLAVNESYTFTVQPKPGLAVGAYSENMVFAISENAATYTLPLSVQVKKSNAKAAFTAVSSENDSFGGAIDEEDSAKATADFGAVIEGYDFTGGSPLNIEITNTGEESIQFNNVTSEKYTLTYSRTPASLGKNSKMVLSILPKGGLTAGSHDETVTLTTVQGFSMNLSLKFSVEEATVSLEYTDAFGNVAGTGSERSKRLRVPFCLTDDTKKSGFTIKNTGNVPIMISSIAGETNSTFAFTDSTLDPGEETTCTITYTGDAYQNNTEDPNLTVNVVSGGETCTRTLYALYIFGYRGEYRPQDLPTGEIRLVGDTIVKLEDGDDLDGGKYVKNPYLTRTYIGSMHFPVTLTFKGSNNGKLETTISTDATLDTLKIEGGDIRLKGSLGSSSSSSWVDKLIMTGGKLGTNAVSFTAMIKSVEISGGECDFSDSWAAYVQDSFKVSGGKFIGNKLIRNNDDNGGQIIPEAVISGTGQVEIIGKKDNDNMYVKDLTVSDSATLAAAGAYSPLIIDGSLTLGDDIKVLLPAGGRFDALEKRFKDSADQDYYGPVKIGPEPTVVTNPAFTIEPAVVTAASFVEGQYPDPYPEGDKAIVTVTNTGDTELTFASFASEKFAVSAYSKSKLEPEESMTFKIWPKNIPEAAAGSYAEDLTISTNAGISQTFTAKFEITAAPEPVYGLTATPASIDFGEKFVDELVGANGFKAVTVTLTNTGNQKQTIKDVTQNAGHRFTIYDGLPKEGDEIAAGESKTFKVIPGADFNTSGTSDLSLVITTEHGETVTITAHASITDIAAGQLIVKRIPDVTYNGKAQKPEPEVYYGSLRRKLSSADYTLSYSNNTNAGNAGSVKKGKPIPPTVTIKGKGNYKDTASVTFTINPIDIASEVYTDLDEAVKGGLTVAHLTVAYNKGKPVKIAPVLKCDIDGKAVTLKKGTDYTLDQDTLSDEGIHTVKVQGVVGGNFSGERDLKVYVAKDETMISAAKFPFIPDQKYSGKSFELGVTETASTKPLKSAAGDFNWNITYKNKPLTSGTDYRLAYAANKEIGTATVYVYGTGDYAGVVSKTFKITGIDMKKVTFLKDITKSTEYADLYDKNAFVYTGQPFEVAGPADESETYGIDLQYKYKENGTQKVDDLTKGEDYTVTYDNNTEPGTATVIFTGKGNYAGTVKKTFKIKAQDVAKTGTISVYLPDDTTKEWKVTSKAAEDDVPEIPFVKGGVKPEPVVVYSYTGREDETLKAGVDYTLAWSNNTKPGAYNATNRSKSIAPTVTLTFKGRFAGKTERTFTITNGILNTELQATDLVYQKDKAGLHTKTKITVRDSSGQILKAGTDYYAVNDKDHPFVFTFDKLADTPVTEKSGKNWVPVDELDVGSKVENTYCIPAGTRIKVTVTGKGFYEGQTAAGYFEFATYDFTKATVTIPDDMKTQVYTGKPLTLDPKKLTVTIKDVGASLTYDAEEASNSDFTIVSYDKNTNVGTATAVLKGNPKKGYAGEKTVSFKIAARQMYETIHYRANADSTKYGLFKALQAKGKVSNWDEYVSNYQVIGTMKDSVIPKGGKLVKNAFKVQKKNARGRWVTATEVTFAGWNTRQDGTGANFADQAAFTPSWISALLYGENWTLYAQWEAVL